MVAHDGGDGRVPDEVARLGFVYFLEIRTARDVLEGYAKAYLLLEGLCDKVIYYATNDAYEP